MGKSQCWLLYFNCVPDVTFNFDSQCSVGLPNDAVGWPAVCVCVCMCVRALVCVLFPNLTCFFVS